VRLCSGPCESITTRRIVIAVGGRPKYDDKVPGSELCITSDDLFSLEKAPGKTLVIGASYIALECAGFLAELGMDTTVMARSKVLRTFDQDMADRIVDNMRQGDVKFLEGFSPVKFDKEPETGRIRVTYKDNAKKSKDAAADDDGLLTEVYDTVLSAIGRVPNTANIGLQDLGVELAPNGKVYHHNERTTVPNIYVIGDCGEPSIELTPVAIKQGMLLAQRLYNGSDVTVDFSFYPTTVFTPIEYGTIGVSEERAIEVFGEDQIDVFHAEFTPLEHFLPHRSTTCYVKIIVNYRDKQRIIGLHYLGPNAGEVTQGFAAAFKAGLKKKDFDAIIGIHPTTAEEVVTLRRTKKSGLDPKKTGC
jgi:thioredoxin reductase (NADPH)